MATSKKTASLKKPDPGTRTLAVRVPMNVVSLKESLKGELATLASRTAPPGGDKIRITQDKKFALPDGRTHPGPLELVIIDFVSNNNFYEGKYDPKNITPPACFAVGTNPTALVPSNNSPDKQAETCSVCPNNVFGSEGDGKACKNGRLLAILAPDTKPDDPLMLLQVSPTAMKGFDAYVRNVAAQFGLPPIGVITTVSFNPNETYAQLIFGEPKPAPDDLLALCGARREEARTRLMTEPDVSQFGKAKATPAKKVARR